MSGWVAKRFWERAEVQPCEGGYTVTLDGRSVKTPTKALLVASTEAMAQAVADEWQAQDGVIRPDTMPMTRFVNSAIDKVVPQFDAVVGEVAKYGATDLLCYRAAAPEGLVERQAAWDDVLDWAATALEAPLNVTVGVVPVTQPEASLAHLNARVRSVTAEELTALHDLVAISGSLILGLAVVDGRLTGPEAYALSRIDEAWQAEKWGQDEGAVDADEKRLRAYLEADRFLSLCR